MPNNENGFTAEIESSPPTPPVESTPDQITTINPHLNTTQGITRRDFIKAAAVTSIAPNIQQHRDPERKESLIVEIEQLKAEIYKYWKFKIDIDSIPANKEDIPLSTDEQLRILKEVKDTLMFFPPNLGDMLAESYTNFDNTSEDSAQTTNLITANVQQEFSIKIKELGKADYKKVGEQVDIGGVAINNEGIGLDNDVQVSAHNAEYNIKTVLIHELGHFFYFVANSPTIMAAKKDKNPYLGEEYLNADPTVNRKEGFISPYSMFDSHEDFAETFTAVFTNGGLIENLERMNDEVDRPLISKLQIAREIASLVTHGEMDKRYFADLARNGIPKNIEYWANKEPEEHWMLQDPDARNTLYIGDVNSEDPNAPIEPILVLASQSKIESGDNTFDGEFTPSNIIKIGEDSFYVHTMWYNSGSQLVLIRNDSKIYKTLPVKLEGGTETKVVLRTATTEYEFDIKMVLGENGGFNIKKIREEDILPKFPDTPINEGVKPDKGTLIPIILAGKKLFVRLPSADKPIEPTTNTPQAFNTVMSKRDFLTNAFKGGAAVAVTSLLVKSNTENQTDNTLNTVTLVKQRFNRPSPQFVS